MDAEAQTTRLVLLAEDDPQDAKMTLQALEALHLADAIVVVRDGAEALDYLYRRKKFQGRPTGDPSLVILDNKMPKVSGLEVVKIIKADAQLKTIPVVAFTSSRLMSDVMEFYKHGVNAYVVKPMDFPEFVKVVTQIGVFWMTVNELSPKPVLVG